MVEINREDFAESIVNIGRVTKVVKGGRRFSFSALVVVGDGNGKAGFGVGKANEVTEAIRKGVSQATRSMKTIVFEENTIPHEIKGHFGSGLVLLKPAPKGHGIIAAGTVRAVMEASGIADISAKSLGSRNPHNMVRATFDGLAQLRTFEEVARLRGKSVEYLKSHK
jgi:small subunit ribosomal protein S5